MHWLYHTSSDWLMSSPSMFSMYDALSTREQVRWEARELWHDFIIVVTWTIGVFLLSFIPLSVFTGAMLVFIAMHDIMLLVLAYWSLFHWYQCVKLCVVGEREKEREREGRAFRGKSRTSMSRLLGTQRHFNFHFTLALMTTTCVGLFYVAGMYKLWSIDAYFMYYRKS